MTCPASSLAVCRPRRPRRRLGKLRRPTPVSRGWAHPGRAIAVQRTSCDVAQMRDLQVRFWLMKFVWKTHGLLYTGFEQVPTDHVTTKHCSISLYVARPATPTPMHPTTHDTAVAHLGVPAENGRKSYAGGVAMGHVEGRA